MDLSNLSDADLDLLINQAQQKTNQATALSTKPTMRNAEEDEGSLMSFGRGALDAITLGAYPKIVGRIGSLINPELGYEAIRDVGREQNELAAKQHPYANLAGSIVGSAALPFPARSIKQAAGLGALYGAGYGLGSSDEGPTNTVTSDDVANAVYNAGLGGIAGAAGYGLLNKMLGKNAGPSPEAAERLRLSKEFDIPLTRGEALNDPAAYLKEEAALQGRLGDSNQKLLKEFNDRRLEKFKTQAENLRSNIGGGNEFIEKGGNLEQPIRDLKDVARNEKERYSQLYKEATQGVSNVSKQDFNIFNEQIAQDLSASVLTPDNVPGAYAELKSLEKLIENQSTDIDFKKLEAWRQGVNRSYRSAMKSGNEQEAFALSQIKNKFDGFIDGAIEKSLESGDFNSLSKFKQARELTAQWHQKYTPKNPTEYGKKFIKDILDNEKLSDTPYTNEQIVNKIFGTSELGFKPESAAIVKELKSRMSPEDFNSVKLEAAQKLIAPLLKNTPNVQTYNNNLHKFIRSNPTLAKELFPKSDLKALTDLGALGTTLFSRPKSNMNPSGTAAVILDQLKRNKYTGFLVNLFDKVQLDQNKIQQEVMRGPKLAVEENVKTPMLGNSVASGVTNAIKSQGTNEVNEPKEQKNIEATQNPQTYDFSSLSDEELDRLISQRQGQNNEGLLDKIAFVESGNNPNAKNKSSSASGLYQMTDSTWRSLANKYNIVGNKNDPAVQREAASLLLTENKNILSRNLQREPDQKELYIAHFMGPEQATKLIERKNDNVSAVHMFPKEAKFNRSIFFNNGKPRTTKEVYHILTKKI